MTFNLIISWRVPSVQLVKQNEIVNGTMVVRSISIVAPKGRLHPG